METKDQIKNWRLANKQTQAQLATRLGITVSTLARWEQGVRHPSGLYRQALEKLLAETQKV